MKMKQRYTIDKIIISERNIKKIEYHCIRKLRKMYEDGETKEQQAFGVIIGKQCRNVLQITQVIPLKVNYRYNNLMSEKMNNLIEKYAIPGGLNIEERAWVSDPIEIAGILNKIDSNEKFIGTYHMHHDKSWKGDYPKQIPTKLDAILAEKSGMYNLIVYINLENNENSVRAFYESKVEKEVEIYKYCK